MITQFRMFAICPSLLSLAGTVFAAPQPQKDGLVSPKTNAAPQRPDCSYKDLHGKNLIGKDLRGVWSYESQLDHAVLDNADASRVSFVGASLVKARLWHAKLTRAYFNYCDLTKADFRGADLRGADFLQARLVGARLTGAKLAGAELSAADLREADLRGADLRFVQGPLHDARNADNASHLLFSVNLQGAIYDQSTRWPRHMRPEAFGAVQVPRRSHQSSHIVLRNTNIHGTSTIGPKYVTLDAPYSSRDTVVSALNNQGEVIGGYWDREAGFAWGRGIYTPIHLPNGGVSNGLTCAINNRGQIVGEYQDRKSRFHGFLLSGNRYRLLDYPHSTFTSAESINSIGQIAGQYQDRHGRSYGFLWQRGVFTRINFPRAAVTNVTNINDQGQMVGLFSRSKLSSLKSAQWQGFFYHGGTFTQIKPPLSMSVENIIVNTQGQVAGTFEDRSGYSHGFLWIGGSCKILNFPTILLSATKTIFFAVQTRVTGMNSRGELVGNVTWNENGLSGRSLPFLWLHDVFRNTDSPSGAFAYAINDSGQIVGSYLDHHGSVHGFLTRVQIAAIPAFVVPTGIKNLNMGQHQSRNR